MLFEKMEARKIDKIVATFYNQFCSIEPELIFFYKMNSKQRIFIQCSKCEKNQGVYSIRAQKSWMNEFIQHNGDLKKFHILSSYYLLKIVKSIHGVAIAENAYESNFVVNVIERIQ